MKGLKYYSLQDALDAHDGKEYTIIVRSFKFSLDQSFRPPVFYRLLHHVEFVDYYNVPYRVARKDGKRYIIVDKYENVCVWGRAT